MNRSFQALLTLTLFGISLQFSQGAEVTTTWTGAAGDDIFTNSGNYDNGAPGAMSIVVIGPPAGTAGNTAIHLAGSSTTYESLTLTNTLASGLTFDRLNNETMTITGDSSGNLIVNNSGFVDQFSVPVNIGGNGLIAGGTGVTFNNLAIGTNAVTTSGLVTIVNGGTLSILINTDSAGGFGTIGPVTVTGAGIVISGTYLGNAGDSFDLTTGNFNGYGSLSLPTLSPGLSWDTTNFASQGVLTVDAAGNIINTGQTLMVNNDTTGSTNGFPYAGGVTFNGGELLTNNANNAANGTPFTTNRGLVVTSAGGTIAATSGTTATYTGDFNDSGGGSHGTVTIGDGTNDGTVIFLGNNGYSGETVITAGATLQLGTATAEGGESTSDFVDNGSLVLFFNTTGSEGGTPITGTGTVTQAGSATLQLFGQDTYSGGTIINGGGAIQLNGSGHLGGGPLTITNNSSFDLNGLNQTVSLLTLNTGTVTTSTNTASTLTTTGVTVTGAGNTIDPDVTVTGTATFGSGAALAVKGTLSGDAIVGNGTLSGFGTIGGATSVTGGTVTGTGLTLTGLTTFNGAGNTLSGTETATAGVTVATGAGLVQTGTLTGNLADNGTSTLSGTISGNLTGTGTTTLNGAVTGTAAVSAGGNLGGSGAVAGATTVTSGTINGNGLTLTGLATFNGAGNTLSGTETATSGVTVATGAALTQSGTLTGNLADNGTSTLGGTITGNLTGTGTTTLNGNVTGTAAVGAGGSLGGSGSVAGTTTVTSGTINGNGVTLTGLATFNGANNVLSGTETATAGVVVASGGSLTQSGGTLTGNLTDNGTTTLNGTVNGTTLVSSTGTLLGVGTAGATTVNGGGAINMQNGSIGTLTVGGLTFSTSTTASALSFDINSSAADKIQDNGTLTLNSGTGKTTISVDALGGTLTDGSYVLINATGAVTGNLSDLALSTTTLDGKVLSLSLSGGNLDLVVADSTTPVGTTYNLTTTAGATRLIAGQTTTLTTTITNTGTGTADTLDFTGLGANGTTVSGATTSGGPLANNGGSASNTGQTFSDIISTGPHVVNPTVSSATNPNVGGNATLGTATGVTIDVLANRTVNATNVALGRSLVGQSTGTVTTTLSSVTGQDSAFTRITVGSTAQSDGVTNGTITLGGGTSYQFGGANDGTNSTSRGVSGVFTAAGNQTGTATIMPTGEGLTGESINPIAITYTADAVNKRTITDGAATNLGVVHSGATVTGTSTAFTTTGLNATTTSVSVAAGSGTADAHGVTLNGAANTFDGSVATQTGTRTFGGTLTSANGGTVTGTFTLGVTTLENGGAGLAGEGTYAPVDVAYTSFVYTGQGVYTGAGSSSYGTVSANPANWAANGGVPGLDPNFVSTDSATFGNSIGATSATVTLDGDNPSLKAITFANTMGGSYTLAQGTGGSFSLNNGVNTATITDSSGNNTISAPIILDSNSSASVAAGDTLTLSGNISDVGGKSLTLIGPGTTILSGTNSYTGGTTLNSGTLDANSVTSLGTGPLAVGGGVLDLDGLNHTTGAVTITGASTIQNGTLTGTSYNDSAAAGTTTVSAVLAGNGGLTKSGGSTLALNGANTFSGNTTISGGTVAAGNATAFGTGNVTLSAGTLETGNGTHQINVAGNYTQTGGTLVLNLTGLTPNASPGYEDLHVTGTANLGGGLVVNVSAPYVPVAGDMFTFVQAGNITGGFSSVSTNLRSLSITVQGAGVILNQVPIATIPGVTYSANEASVAQYVDRSFQGGANSAGFQLLLTSLDNVVNGSDPQSLAGALDQLTPEKFSNFVRTTVFNNASFSTQELDSYLEGQRSITGDFLVGNGQIDSSGLSIVGPDMDSALGQVESHMLAWNPAPLAHGLLSDTVDPVTTGMDMKQMKPAPAAETSNKFNAFILGNVVLAQGFSQQDVAHSDTTTGAVTVGGDFRITPNLRVGALFAYGHTDADLDTLGSKATIDSYAPGVYASYANGGWYVNALGSYGFNSYTEDRNISFGGLDGRAHGAPGGDQIVGNLDGGYDFHVKNFTFGPTVGLQYTHLDVDSFSEDGLDPVDLSVNKEETDSLRSRVGGHVSYVFQAPGKILITPHLDASWQHEFLDQGRGITSQFNTVGVGSFSIQTPNPSRDSALIDTGVSADLNGQVSLYLDYLVQAGQDNYFGQAVQAGVKIGF